MCLFALSMGHSTKEAFREKDCAMAKESRSGMTGVYMKVIGL